MRNAFAITLVLLMLSAASCGYSVRGSGAITDGGASYQSIAIPMFSNDTYEPLLQDAVTSALKQEVVYDGRLSLVEQEDADLVVRGRIVRFELQPLTFDAAERIQEYRLKITTEVRVIEHGKDKPVWMESKLEAYADYRVTQDVTKSKINKQEAIRKASKNLAEKFIIRALDIL